MPPQLACPTVFVIRRGHSVPLQGETRLRFTLRVTFLHSFDGEYRVTLKGFCSGNERTERFTVPTQVIRWMAVATCTVRLDTIGKKALVFLKLSESPYRDDKRVEASSRNFPKSSSHVAGQNLILTSQIKSAKCMCGVLVLMLILSMCSLFRRGFPSMKRVIPFQFGVW